MSNKELWSLIDSMKNKTRVIGPVQRYLEREEDDKERRADIIHPSELASEHWCRRHDYYRISGVPFDRRFIRFGLRNVFDEGHDIHDKWQKRLWRMGVLRGRYACRLCGYQWEDTSPTRCPTCLNGLLKYKEVPLEAPEYLLAGHADGQIDDDQPPTLLEVKSLHIGTVRFADPSLLYQHTHKLDGRSIVDIEGMWNDITKPFASHLRQINLYMFMANIHEAVVLYENKATQAIKEFQISFLPSIVEPMLEDALDLVEDLQAQVVPTRPTWANKNHKECKACPFRKVCYEESESGGGGVSDGVSRAPIARTPRRWSEATAGSPVVDRTVRRGTDGTVRKSGSLVGLLERAAGGSGD